MEIYYDETRNAWYASIPVEVGVEKTKTGKESKHIVYGERKTISVESPKGNKVTSIDLGINVLASVVLNDGTWLLYLGYPFNIAQEKGNKFTVNMWSYRKLIDTIELKAQEYGIKVFEVVEYNTSKYCAYHNVEVKRRPRGVISCPLKHKLHSDLNGALNILKKATGKVLSSIKKPLSFIVEHNRVAPIKGV
ncbi:MAG: zinc ribbon domain-containing protein [Caldisphaera sp.]